MTLLAELYKGYYIRSRASGGIWIEKNCVMVAWAKSFVEAKQRIDGITLDLGASVGGQSEPPSGAKPGTNVQ
jgi:hypothetical protein